MSIMKTNHLKTGKANSQNTVHIKPQSINTQQSTFIQKQPLSQTFSQSQNAAIHVAVTLNPWQNS